MCWVVRFSFAEQLEDLMQKGAAAQRAGDAELSAKFYNEALRLRPHYGPAEYNLGLVKIVQKRYADAITVFSQAVKDDPSLVDCYLFQGISYYNVQEFDRAVPPLKKFLELQPGDGQVRFFLAASYEALHDVPNAALQYLGQIELTPQREQLYYYLGECYLEMARGALKVLSGLPAEQYYVSLILGEQETHEKNFPVATQFYERAIKLSPQRTEAYVDLGNLFLQTGQTSKAAAQFKEALKRSPKDCRALDGLGDVAFATGDLKGAFENYRAVAGIMPPCIEEPAFESLGLPPSEFSARLKSLEALIPAKGKRGLEAELARLTCPISGNPADGTNPEQPSRESTFPGPRRNRECPAAKLSGGFHSPAQADLFLATCCELHDDLQCATSAVMAAQRQAPGDFPTAYWAFRIYLRLSQRVFGAIAALSPDSYLLAEMRAEWLELRGKDTEADSEYQKAVQLGGGDPNPLIDYARFDCKQNKLDEAIPLLEKALSLALYNADATSLLGYIYFTKNDYQTALPYLQKAIKARPNDEYSRIYLGQSLERVGRIQEAVTVLESAPSDTDGRIHYVLASCYRKLGQKEQMERALAFFAAHKGQPQKRETPY